MKKSHITLLIGICFSSTILFSYAVENDMISRKADEIREKEKMKYSCKLSDREAYEALSFYLNTKKITLESFRKIADQGSKIVEGLYMVVEKKMPASKVFEKLQMSKYDITKQTWDSYVIKYTSLEKVKKLEQMIPNNMDVVINSGKHVFALNIENWLLEQYILSTDRSKEKKTDQEKINFFWSNVLKKYDFDDAMKNKLITLLSKKANFSLAESESWKKYFADKLIDMNKTPRRD
mgnify:CR=1 FL=1